MSRHQRGLALLVKQILYLENFMDVTSTSPGSDSPSSGGRRNVAAHFATSEKSEAAIQALKTAGFARDEMRQEEQDGGYLVTVGNHERLADALALLQAHGGSVAQGDLTTHDTQSDAAHAVAESDADDSATPTTPADDGLSAPTGGKKVGGGTFTSGSEAGGSGSGTATGGSLFGSSR